MANNEVDTDNLSTLGESEDAQGMASFLLSVERKGYRIAMVALGQHADAMDVLQDAMCKLVSKYNDKPAAQWKPLFYRILHNRINDWHRQNKLKSMLFFWRDDEEDPVENVSDGALNAEPLAQNEKKQQQDAVIEAIATLPLKQQQCFLLRTWEGLSVKETALAMECSEGSVKTHFFRAVEKLRALLGGQYDLKI